MCRNLSTRVVHWRVDNTCRNKVPPLCLTSLYGPIQVIYYGSLFSRPPQTTELSRRAEMSAVPSPPTLRARLETFECHFTWNLNSQRKDLFLLRDILEDIGAEDGNLWRGHIYNLQAYVHFLLASEEETPGSTMSDALRCFGQAGEAFRQVRNPVADDGPWLLVNYGNLAWLHYHREEWSESLAYLGKAEALLREYPSPIQGQPHQVVLAEKAWTLMNFGQAGKRSAVELFGKAIEVQPAGPVEWTTSHALALATSSPPYTSSPEQEADILETLRCAVEGDPDNLYIAVVYLGRRAMTDSTGIAERARELTEEVLKRSQTSYSGIRPLLRVYSEHVSLDEAIDVAKEALERHPTNRHLKYGLANCYKWKIFSDRDRDSPLIEDLRSRAIGLYEELCSLYPHSFLLGRIALASLYAQSRNPDNMEADKIFRDLLEIDLEPAQRQILYNKYAKFLHFSLQDRRRSIDYLMKAAEILHSSRFRRESIDILTQIMNRRMDRMSGEIEDFLAQLTL
ncbi:interferon-induced protein with tetratricopeptide repeats 2-like [Gadus macrocephalus]|uniref:interferon-induced protein with tetratricopeptide repeats 2-like n=1 Tax=Gadus macrocephalus TaxID=80720 RepID=UPI0028CB9CFE|nr:interferon-induced protein with tetratricopeptide repeats 2-like [Gadus macrocephalus]